MLEILFNDLTFIVRKRRILCKLSEKFSIPLENIWTWEGFNCDTSYEEAFKVDQLLINE